MPFDPESAVAIDEAPSRFDPSSATEFEPVEEKPRLIRAPLPTLGAQGRQMLAEGDAALSQPLIGPKSALLRPPVADLLPEGTAKETLLAAGEPLRDLASGMTSAKGVAGIAATVAAPEVMVPLLGAASIPTAVEGGKELLSVESFPAAARGFSKLGVGLAGVLLGAAKILPKSVAAVKDVPPLEPPPVIRKQLPAPRTRMPEVSQSTAEEAAGTGTVPAGYLPAPGESEATFELLPGSELAPRTEGFRIQLPVESETAAKARKVWSKPIDIEAQVEGADAMRQLASMTEEAKTPGEPYKPPTVNVDLRQLERMMQRNTVSKVESWADETIQGKLRETGANPFLDPEFMAAAMTKGAILFKRGVTKFSDWSDEMRKQFGRGMEDQLPVIYKQSRDYWESRGENKPPTLSTGAASQAETPTAATVSEGKPPGVAAPGEPPAISQPTTQPNRVQAQPETIAAPPPVPTETGASKPAPWGSGMGPNTPPDSNPWPAYANRVTTAFRDWWERVWPRSLATSRIEPGTPVITEHQRLLFDQMKFMEDFSNQDWWKALRERDNNELIDIEDRMVKDFYQRVEAGEPVADAYRNAVATAPEDIQALIRHRDSRIPIESAAAKDLAVVQPPYRGEPYIARLTNEEGKAIVDLQPNIPGWTRQIRESLGSFAQSRTHLTMKDGIEAGTQYDPVARAVWIRELVSIKLESTANMLRKLKEGGVLYDTREEALKASPNKEPWKVRGFGGNDYWARTRQEARFLEQNLTSSGGNNPLRKLTNLANTYVRNPSLVNPLPHVTKNMLFKYIMARVNSAQLKADVAEFQSATPTELRARFDKVMPMTESGMRLPQLTAKEVGTLPEKIMGRGLMVNNPSTAFIFGKADPGMRFSLWKSYIRKGMSDQEAANHVWMDLVRYDENSGGINFWKSIPMNFFVPWRTGTYTTLYKAFTSHPYRTALFVGAVEYLREMRYRKTGRWTHLPIDYIDAPLSEAIDKPSRAPAIAATTLLFGPGGGQAPSSIKDLMAALHNDPGNKSRILNMFWGISQIYNMPREWNAYRKDGNVDHLINLLTSAALAEHSALKYQPRRLMQWMPEWMPMQQKSELVNLAERLQKRVEKKQEKRQSTYERKHGVSATFERAPEEQQLQELRKSAR